MTPKRATRSNPIPHIAAIAASALACKQQPATVTAEPDAAPPPPPPIEAAAAVLFDVDASVIDAPSDAPADAVTDAQRPRRDGGKAAIDPNTDILNALNDPSLGDLSNLHNASGGMSNVQQPGLQFGSLNNPGGIGSLGTLGTCDRGAAKSALDASVKSIHDTCKSSDPRGHGHAVITFDPSGNASRVVVAPPFRGTGVASCIEGKLKTAKVPPFTGDPVSFSRGFDIP